MAAKAPKGYKGIGMDGVIATWYARNTRKSIEEYRKDAQKVAERLSGGEEILELAPGPGYLSIELAKLGNFRITGLDISETFVEIARKNAPEDQDVALKLIHAAHDQRRQFEAVVNEAMAISAVRHPNVVSCLS